MFLMTKPTLILTLNDPAEALILGAVGNRCYKLGARLIIYAGNFCFNFIV